MKLSFSPSAIKSFFVNHTEKVVFVGVGLSLLTVCWNAFMIPILPIQPQHILAKVDQAKNNLSQSKPREIPPRATSKWPTMPLPPDVYGEIPPFNPGIHEEQQDDADPVLLAIRKLHTQVVIGPMAVRGEGVVRAAGAAPPAAPPRRAPAGPAAGGGVLDGFAAADEKPRSANRVLIPAGTIGGVRPQGKFGYVGRRMVVLTGLVPVQEQQREYQKAFTGKAPRQTREQREPVYSFFRIERREIAPGVKGEWNKGYVTWTGLRTDWERLEENKKPYVKRAETLHADWAQTAPEVVGPQYRHPLLTSPLPPMLLVDWREAATHPEIPLLPVQKKTDTDGAAGRGRPRADFPRAGAPRIGAARAGEETEVRVPSAQFQLFRFFDFNVKPNHKYEYRVEAYLRNPNYKIEPKYLAKNKQSERVRIPMSEASPVVSIPADRNIIGGRVTIDEDDGPVATVKSTRWQNEAGTDVISEYRNMPRGAMLDLPKSQFRIDPRPQPAYERMTPRPKSPKELSQDVMVVDARGGDPISEKFQHKTRPGEVLLLTPDGKLIVRRETDDAAEFARRSMDAGQPPREDGAMEPANPKKNPGRGVGIVGGGRKKPAKPVPPRGRPKPPSILDE